MCRRKRVIRKGKRVERVVRKKKCKVKKKKDAHRLMERTLLFQGKNVSSILTGRKGACSDKCGRAHALQAWGCGFDFHRVQ